MFLFSFFKKRKDRINSLKAEYATLGRHVKSAFSEEAYIDWHLYDQRYLNFVYIEASKMDSEENKRRAINDKSKLNWLIKNGFVNDFDKNKVDTSGFIQTLCWYNPNSRLLQTRSYIEDHTIDELNEWLLRQNEAIVEAILGEGI